MAFSLTTLAADLPCAASVNGTDLMLEQSPSGLYLIAVEDPNFDQYDVVVDTSKPGKVKLRVAKFIATELVPKLKAELLKLSPEMQAEILKLAKARIVDASAGYDALGFASVSLRQGEDSISLSCWK